MTQGPTNLEKVLVLRLGGEITVDGTDFADVHGLAWERVENKDATGSVTLRVFRRDDPRRMIIDQVPEPASRPLRCTRCQQSPTFCTCPPFFTGMDDGINLFPGS